MDSVLSWGILVLLAICGFFWVVRKAAEEKEARDAENDRLFYHRQRKKLGKNVAVAAV